MTRDEADAIIQRTGMLALLYYGQIHNDDPEFDLDGDIRWCLEGATGLTHAVGGVVRDTVGRTIVDPTAHREQLTKVVYGLVSAS